MQSPFSGLLILKSVEGRTFYVKDAAVAAKFLVIKNMVEDGYANGVIPVPDVDSSTLGAMMEWCKKHASGAKDEELKAWDAEFVKSFDESRLYDLLRAADFLGGVELVDLLAARVADMMKAKTAEEIRDMFKIKNDFTPEQEEALRKKNTWRFK